MNNRLLKKLNEWMSLGFIDQQQVRRITDYENNSDQTSWVLTGLLMLGAIVIGIGIISVAAANWNQLSNTVKLSADFILLALLAVITINAHKKNHLVAFEVLLLSYLIAVLASIYLISKIYGQSGSYANLFLFWSLITLFVISTTMLRFTVFVWISAFIYGLVISILNYIDLHFFANSLSFAYMWIPLLMWVPLFCLTLMIVCQTYAKKEIYAQSFFFWTVASGLLEIIFIELVRLDPFFNVSSIGDPLMRFITYQKNTAIYTNCIALPLLVFVVIWCFNNKRFSKFSKTMFFVTLGLFISMFQLPAFGFNEPYNLFYSVFSILILTSVTILFASLAKQRLFQIFLLFTGIRFFVLCLQQFGGLAMSGVGLILSGVSFIVITLLWYKYKGKLGIWVEELANDK